MEGNLTRLKFRRRSGIQSRSLLLYIYRPLYKRVSAFIYIFLSFILFLSQENSDQSSLRLDDRYFMSVLLEPRSLFLLTEDLYHNYLHGIAERTCDTVTEKVANLDACNATLGETLRRGTRISLTIRNVPKILKFKINLGR